MAGLEVDSNAGEVARSLYRAAGELSSLEDANARAGGIVAEAAQPVRSGLLAQSVRADATASGVTIAGHVRYWSFVEWGAPRRNVMAQHRLRTQAQDRESDIIAVYLDHAARVVAKLGD